MMNFLKDWIIQYQNKFSVGGVETTIDRITGTVSQEGDTISAAYLNEIQKNCIYQVNATRIIEGVLEIYDITINGSEEFTPFNQTFLIDFSATNTQADSLLRFNGNTYSLRFSYSITNGDISTGIGFIPKRAFVKLDVANSKAIIVSNLDFNFETITVTTATGSYNIPSDLPVGTKKLVRKLNSAQGTVFINAQGSEKITPSLLTTIKLNSDGDFWLIEKVSSTRWDILEGHETGSTGTGRYACYADGTQECDLYTGVSIPLAVGAISGYTWTFPKAFKDTVIVVQADASNSDTIDFYGATFVDTIASVSKVSFVIRNGITMAVTCNRVGMTAKGRWY